MEKHFFLLVAADAFGVPRGHVDGAACIPSVVSAEEWQLLEGELGPGFLQVCWEAICVKGYVVEGGTEGVLEASHELDVRRVAQCGGELLDWCGVVVLFVFGLVWRVLGYPVGGLCRRGYRWQVLQVVVLCGFESYVFELWSVVGDPVFGMRVRASIAVCVAVRLLFDDEQRVLAVHASEGYPQPQHLCGKA